MLVSGSALGLGALALRLTEQRNIARAAETRATRERTSADELATFLESLFGHANASAEAMEQPSLHQVLEVGAARVDSVEDPLVRARLMHMLGRVYGQLDELARGRELLESALAIRREHLAGGHLDVVETLQELSLLMTRQGDHAAAEAAACQALDLLLANPAADAALVANAWTLRGSGRFYAEDNAAAVDCFRTALEMQRRLHPEAHAELAIAIANLGQALIHAGDLEEAESLLRESIAMRGALGDPSGLLLALEGLAQLEWRIDRRESECYYAEELALARSIYRPEHPGLAWVLMQYGYVVEQNHGPAAAESLFREALQIQRDAGTATARSDLARATEMLGVNLDLQGKHAEAASILDEDFALNLELRGPEHPNTVKALGFLEAALRGSD